MTRDRIHVALIVPASNTTMEPDFHRELGEGLTISTWRIVLESVTREAEERMLAEELPRCLAGIRPTHPDLVVFGCTSAGALDGLSHDAGISEEIGRTTGAPVITVVASMVEQLAAVGANRVAVLTPYQDELTRSVASCVAEAGCDVAAALGMGISDNRAIGAVHPEAIADFVGAHMDGVEADTVFLSCTNWRAMEALEAIRAQLGVKVLSSNQVTLASVRRALAS